MINIIKVKGKCSKKAEYVKFPRKENIRFIFLLMYFSLNKQSITISGQKAFILKFPKIFIKNKIINK
jgi:hypothetical protein